jgi:tetratricopeptide (TPR) repeat protein
MKSRYCALFLLLALHPLLNAQVTSILIPAGSPEDKAIQAATAETDLQKRTALLQQMAKDFASNPNAVAYACSTLSQQALAAGDAAQALAYGDQALAAQPNNLDLLVVQVQVAQQLKQNAKVVDYAVQGGKAYLGIGNEPKPEGLSDEDFARHSEDARAANKNAYSILENSAYGAISAETDARQRTDDISRFLAAFPNSSYKGALSQLALYALQQQGDWQKLYEAGEKLAAADPDNFTTLALLASAYAEDPKNAHLDKVMEYGKKAVELAKADDPAADQQRKLSAGLAHSAMGYALMKEHKTAQAAAELKKGADLLESNPDACAPVLYRLGNAYAMLSRYAEARAVLTKAAAIPGPVQQPSRQLLEQVRAKTGK